MQMDETDLYDIRKECPSPADLVSSGHKIPLFLDIHAG